MDRFKTWVSKYPKTATFILGLQLIAVFMMIYMEEIFSPFLVEGVLLIVAPLLAKAGEDLS